MEEPGVVSLDAVLPPEPEYDVPPPPRRDPDEEPKPKRRSRARTTKDTTPPGKKKEPVKLTPKDYTQDLTALTDAVWIAGSSIGMTAPYAAVLKMNQVQLVQALNAGANSNATVRRYVETFSGSGNATWVVQLGMVAVQMGMQGLQLSRDKEFRERLVEANSEALQTYLAQFRTPEHREE